ncbi:hypothetical protein [Rhodospirillum rubrum]|uniref:hypothetical protein n=1 Tax=Rhodospirillum rubrum TaxID=1085 RepID=UPI0019048284|nr:hypothetical protein [Rhodospirillum rubrum]
MDILIIIELVIFFGGVIGLCLWQLYTLHRPSTTEPLNGPPTWWQFPRHWNRALDLLILAKNRKQKF